MYGQLETQISITTICEPAMALVWENLSCDGEGSFCTRLMRRISFAAFARKKSEKILSNVSGSFNFGELTALMGPSGAGKSTLLKCLTQGKNYPGTNMDRIAVGKETQVRACLITQNDKDHLLLNLTVVEALRYASQMKNPYNTNETQHTEIVDGLLDELDLTKAKYTVIDKCSGGQKKRIAIGLELTANTKPNFLFLDEPTSGLDSYSGFNVVFRMRQLAMRRGIAVVTVIHQPSFEIFSQFHNVYILSKVGRCVFYGTPKELHQDLVDYTYITTNSTNMNPADIIIRIASSVSKDDKPATNANTEAITPTATGKSALIRIASSVSKDDNPATNANTEATTPTSTPIATGKSAQDTKTDCENMTKKLAENWHMTPMAGLGRQIEEQGLCSYSANFRLYTLWVLLKRAWVSSIWRQKKLIFIRLALHTVVVVILAALYNRDLGKNDGCIPEETVVQNCSNAGSNDIRSENVPQENVKFQFFSLLFLMFAALMPTVLTFPAEIKLFINEHRNGWYSTSCYYISKTLVEIPLQILFPFCYVYFLYWYTQQLGMDDWYGGFFGFMTSRYSYFLGVTILCCFIAQGLGFLIGILCVNSFPMAIILSSSVLLFLFLFSGFFVKIAVMSAHTKWVTYLSFIRFGFESLLIIIYGNKRCEYLADYITPAKSAILYNFGLEDKDLTKNLYWLVGHLIVIRIVAILLLRSLVDRKFMRIPTSYAFLFNEISPRYKQARLKIGKWTFFVVKVCLIIFLIQLIIGMVWLIIYNMS